MPARNINFSYVNVPSATVNFTNPSTLGHFNSLESLWDGSGCNTTDHNLIYVD